MWKESPERELRKSLRFLRQYLQWAGFQVHYEFYSLLTSALYFNESTHLGRHLPSIFLFADRNGKVAGFDVLKDKMSASVSPPALKWNIDQETVAFLQTEWWRGETHQTSKLLREVFFFNEKATGATPQSLEISSVSPLPPNGTNGGSDIKKNE